MSVSEFGRTCISDVLGPILLKLYKYLVPYLGHMHMQWFHYWIKDGRLTAILIVKMHIWNCIMDTIFRTRYSKHSRQYWFAKHVKHFRHYNFVFPSYVVNSLIGR